MTAGSLRQVAFVSALAVGVTVGGAFVGSLGSVGDPMVLWMSLPEAVRRLALPVLFGAVSLIGFIATGVSLYRRRPAVRLPSAAAMSHAMPSLRGAPRRGRPTSKTPRAVQALAESGAEPTEIAWRTGLSLDAVAMLLSIGTSPRQLRPPTA